ncbi:hypothetical protein CEK26_001600 [Fusarium fujikuroi]|uniref:Uncharacterized protein n=1 Tax=Fusarium fujikuroi TaxID=5127 RepID=A0A2H3R7P9_FUSFU|nr:uncharacterized protein Y057_1474 [Fusarium fujikuroi]QGI59476.1 hypothetical protein CEK27_001601 [Fusarium fujikuroi]QGI90385.1 hypothetical protein CEK26_001600 [Fusarium fujikuroi]SCN69330.1 uncharacterized protein FFC1_00440 [Fusarium fujikuroi]SCO28622.1 uncharacterized protein FFNC_00444 [Fusarium fujikuroi]
MSHLIRSFAFLRRPITRSIQPFSSIIRFTHSQSHSDDKASETPKITLEVLYKEIREQKQMVQELQQYQQQQKQKESQRILEEEQRPWLLKFLNNHENKFK